MNRKYLKDMVSIINKSPPMPTDFLKLRGIWR